MYILYIVSVLIWVQTVCTGYQQRTKIATSKDSVKFVFMKKGYGLIIFFQF